MSQSETPDQITAAEPLHPIGTDAEKQLVIGPGSARFSPAGCGWCSCTLGPPGSPTSAPLYPDCAPRLSRSLSAAASPLNTQKTADKYQHNTHSKHTFCTKKQCEWAFSGEIYLAFGYKTALHIFSVTDVTPVVVLFTLETMWGEKKLFYFIKLPLWGSCG